MYKLSHQDFLEYFPSLVVVKQLYLSYTGLKDY